MMKVDLIYIDSDIIHDERWSHLLKLKPCPSIYCSNFITANQADRADKRLNGTKWEMVQHIQRDTKGFENAKKLYKVGAWKQKNWG